MDYRCHKTGYAPFDSIHAIGLGFLLWGASGQPVTVADDGVCYRVVLETPIQVIDLPSILANLLPLTTPAELHADTHYAARATAVLDGALTWMFTSPGVHAISAASVRRKTPHHPQRAEAAISKWTRLREKACVHAQRVCARLGTATDHLLTGYLANAPQPVSFGPRLSGSISIPLVVEPALGFAYRHQCADGAVAEKTNVIAITPTLASLLLLLGGIYCIRGQEIAGGLVHVYAPIVRQTTIRGTPMLPCFPAPDTSSDDALMRVWLNVERGHLLADGDWACLAYHILQTQGAQQAFSLQRGTLKLSRLPNPSSMKLRLADRWADWLAPSRAQRPPGTDDLIRAVLWQESGAFTAHLHIAALASMRAHQPHWPMYTEDDVREAIVMSNATDGSCTMLVEIINHRQGTYRFGTALRALGNYVPATQRDLVADLDMVRECDQFLRVLARIVEQCRISTAKHPFVVVPDDDDLRRLLADVAQHGTRTIAGLIIILAALRYPRRVEESPESGANSQEREEAV